MAQDRKRIDPDYLFNIFKLNKWFAISSIVLLVGTLLMIKDDYDKEWKQWQRKFRLLEIEKTQKEEKATEEELAGNAEYQSTQAVLAEAAKKSQKNERAAFDQKKVIT